MPLVYILSKARKGFSETFDLHFSFGLEAELEVKIVLFK